MRLLFNIDKKDYYDCTSKYIRNSARAIIIKDNKVAMVHSLKYDFYKFPGGGIEENETNIEALIRETAEEAGLEIIKESIKEYGCVHRILKSDKDSSVCFVQDNFYYLCDVSDKRVEVNLDEHEIDEKYVLEFVDPKIVIEKNFSVKNPPYEKSMFEREAMVIEFLIKEGYLN